MKKNTSGESVTGHSAGAQAPGLISLVIPCYNEAGRLEMMLEGIADFDRKWKGPYEIIVVDDGSVDDTAGRLKTLTEQPYSSLSSRISLLRLEKNQGKGHALKTGVAAAKGDFILTLDADMSALPAELIKWQGINPDVLRSDKLVAIGSRKHEASDVKADGTRRVIGGMFNALVQLLTGLPVRDTQCGFKLYPSAVAKELFAGMKNQGWAHDVELLARARQKGCSIAEMPVKWVNKEESKVNVVRDSVKMFLQVLLIAVRLFIESTFLVPFRLSSIQNKADRREAALRAVFNLLALILLIGMPAIAHQYAVTGDEHWHRDYGTDVYNYFFKGDTKAQTATSGIQYYGGLFDFITAWCYKTFGLASHYGTMHVINALVGAIGIVYAGKLARLLGGTVAGILAMLLIVCSPSFFGHNFANPKDIPFSTGYIAGLYFILLYLHSLPVQNTRAIIGLVLSIGFAMGVRIGGLLLIVYLLAFAASYALLVPGARKMGVKKPLTNIAIVSLLGYFIAILCWPYAQLDIVGKPLEALRVMQNFFININILYEGRQIMSNQVPWYYIPKYIVQTAPLLILVSWVAGLCWIGWKLRTQKPTTAILAGYVVFATIFPVLYAIYKHSSLYDGWRHFLFIYPPMVVLASQPLASMLRSPKAIIRVASVAFIAAGIIHPLRFTFVYHPFQSLYVNEISGGLKSMYGRYEVDYYMLGIRPASEWLLKQEGVKTRKVTVATNCIEPVQEYFASYKNVNVVYVRLYERYQTDWDYCIFFSRYVDPAQLQTGNWPLPETVHTVNVEGVPIASVLKRRTHDDFKGFELIKKQDVAGAKSAFLSAVATYPGNDQAWGMLSRIYEAEQKPDSMLYAGRQALKTHPGDITIVQSLGNALMKQQRSTEALGLYDTLALYHPDYGHLLKATVYAGGGKAEQALQEIDLSLQGDGRNAQALQFGIQIAQQIGDSERLDRYTAMADRLQEEAEQEAARKKSD